MCVGLGARREDFLFLNGNDKLSEDLDFNIFSSISRQGFYYSVLSWEDSISHLRVFARNKTSPRQIADAHLQLCNLVREGKKDQQMIDQILA